jgi:hypothetical protein
LFSDFKMSKIFGSYEYSNGSKMHKLIDLLETKVNNTETKEIVGELKTQFGVMRREYDASLQKLLRIYISILVFMFAFFTYINK